MGTKRGETMVSSKDVAKLAGVSQSTVSRVLNGLPNVRPETRKKVEQAMQKLQYHPNLIARSLAMNRTRTIALISANLHNPFYAETTTAVIQLAAEKGYNTMVFLETMGDHCKLFELAVSHKVDGIIISSIHLDDPVFDLLIRSGTPYMQFNRKHRKGGNYVVLNNFLAGRLAVEHIIQLGHVRIGMIFGPLDISTFFERKEGCFQVLKEWGIDFDPALIKTVDTSREQTERATLDLLHMINPPTAILCATDHMAFYAMDTILSLGIKIPQDISLIGIDDIGIAAHQGIQLTTVAHYKYRMGELAVNHLIHMMESGDMKHPRQIVLEPNLVVRKTTRRI